MSIARLLLYAVAMVAPSALAANICGLNATIGASVIKSVNLTYPGLSAVAAAAAAEDFDTACEALAAYYVTSNTSSWLRVPPVVPGTGMAGGDADDLVLRDIFNLGGVGSRAKIPRNEDGGINWLDKGPRTDVEFMNCLNRHDAFTTTLAAWRATGNPIYSSYFDALLIDWVLHLPCPDAKSAGAACVPLGLNGTACSWDSPPGAQACKTGTMESPWRSLEMGIRMGGPWPVAFFGFQGSAEFSVTARVLAVLAVAEHFAALMVDGGHPGHGTPNWEMTQWQGLLSAASAFPELYNASGARELALFELAALLNDGVYADGIETEQASGYDMGTASDFFNTLLVVSRAGLPRPAPEFTSRVEAMWTYGAFVADGTGCLPRNVDSDRCGRGYSEAAAAYFARPDWTYAVTNGASGSRPTVGPSVVFPWAGQAVFRSGWEKNATWIWFDIGPYGTSGHAHHDKLSLMLHARGAMLLVDSGRFAYQGTDLSATLHSQYASTTHAHNTITIDGLDQQPLPAKATAPVPAESWTTGATVDTAYGSMSLYNGLLGNATHFRAVHYAHPPAGSVDGDWIAVIDIVRGDRQRALQATWHLHPNSTVSIDTSTGTAAVGGVTGESGEPASAQVCVVMAAGAAAAHWDVGSPHIVQGQYQNATTHTAWQGWYSNSYDDAWAAPTLVYDATAAASDVVFGWLLVPTSTRGPCDASIEVVSVTANSATVKVTLGNAAPVTVDIKFSA